MHRLSDGSVGLIRSDTERNPLTITLRLPVASRSSVADLAQIQVKGASGQLVPLAELGRWQAAWVDQTIYHKNPISILPAWQGCYASQ